MPSPIAHLGAGYAIYRLYRHKMPVEDRRLCGPALQPAVLAGLSLLPDLDVIPAIIFRDMQHYHNNLSHSLLVGVPAALLAGALLQRMYRSSFQVSFLIGLTSYDLHVLMDYLTGGRGVMMFWPVTAARFSSPIKLFLGLQWGLTWISIWHLRTFFTEMLFAIALFLLVRQMEKRRTRTTKALPKTDGNAGKPE